MAHILNPDICVIGSNPGGLAVATGAAAYGTSVVLVENGAGGIASGAHRNLQFAALAAAARQAMAIRNAPKFGVSAGDPQIDFRAVMAGAAETVAGTAPEFSPERLATLGIAVVNGPAHFEGRRRLMAGDSEIRARRYVLAAGSVPVVPDIHGLEEVGYLTSETVFDITRRPGHLVIIGSDPWGLAMAQVLNRLGSQITVLMDTALLPDEDPEMAAVVARALRAEGIVIHEKVKVSAVERRGKTSVKVRLETADGAAGEVDASQVLLAAGYTPEIEALNLKKAHVALRDNAVDVSAMLRTTNRRIYAVGDAAGAARSGHCATHHAGLVLKALLFRLPAKDRVAIARVVHTDPEIAHVGLTEIQAAKLYRRLRILRWPYAENDRARAERRTDGHVKIIASDRGKLLGVTFAGTDASDMIGIWALALSKGLGLAEMAASIPPQPTIGETGKNAAMTYFAPAARNRVTRGIVRTLRFFG